MIHCHSKSPFCVKYSTAHTSAERAVVWVNTCKGPQMNSVQRDSERDGATTRQRKTAGKIEKGNRKQMRLCASVCVRINTIQTKCVYVSVNQSFVRSFVCFFSSYSHLSLASFKSSTQLLYHHTHVYMFIHSHNIHTFFFLCSNHRRLVRSTEWTRRTDNLPSTGNREYKRKCRDK